MILPTALALGAQLMLPVADSVPDLNVEQVCDGIAKQGGVTFRDPAVAREKKSCIDSEMLVRAELAKQWSSFSPPDKVSCVNESKDGRGVELHRIADLPGNGARRAQHAQRGEGRARARRPHRGRRARPAPQERPALHRRRRNKRAPGDRPRQP